MISKPFKTNEITQFWFQNLIKPTKYLSCSAAAAAAAAGVAAGVAAAVHAVAAAADFGPVF